VHLANGKRNGQFGINFLFFGVARFEAAGGPIRRFAIRAALCSQADIQGSQLMGKILGWQPLRGEFDMDDAEYCRLQAQECRRLLGMPQSQARTQLLRNLCQSWVRVANQAELYRDIVRHESRSGNGKAA